MLDDIKYLIQVVDAGSFSAAARLVDVNPSSITRRIDRLEQTLGVRLLVRSTRRLALTPDGERLYREGMQLLQQVESLKDSYLQPNETVTGHVAITAFESIGRQFLVPLIAEFKRQYPASRITISLENSTVDLHNSPFDIGVRFGLPEDSSLLYRPLIRSNHVLLASPDYLNRHPPILEPDDLRYHDCLTFYRQRQYTYWHFRRGQNYRQIRIKSALSSQGGSPLLRWAQLGMGLALVSRLFAESALEDGSLVEVLADWQGSPNEQDNREIYLVWKQSSANAPVVRRMIDLMVERLTRSPD